MFQTIQHRILQPVQALRKRVRLLRRFRRISHFGEGIILPARHYFLSLGAELLHHDREILHRFEVKEIEPRERVDRACHRVINYEPADFPEEDGTIVMRVKRGFVWREKLIRPEEVIAKRFG